MSLPGDGPATAAIVEAFSLGCLDGSVVTVADAGIPITDEGLLRGDGVFEVVRLYNGQPFALDEHLERMTESAANLRLPFEKETVAADAAALLDATRPGDGLLRLVVTRGGRRLALLEPLPDLGPNVSLGYVTYSPTRVLDGIKSLSYAANMLAGRLARERGYDEALLVTPHGRVLEAPTASFFWVRDGEVFTPPLDDHVLDSITRRRVLELADVRERPTTPKDVSEADEVFLASTVREVLPVRRVEDQDYTLDGPVTPPLIDAIRRRIDDELGQGA
ncbi:MAG TPA: aminotransferase class IV [Solirubrobacteraceae bacterium]|jgi:branched-chain amino acid aminotransferase|nr:aminotransferase class IV [Solirubrobacteraceae bacterium]